MSKYIQSLVFERKKFKRSEALAWAKKHGFKHYTSRMTAKQIRIRQFPTSLIKNVLGTFPIGKNIKAIYVEKRQ